MPSIHIPQFLRDTATQAAPSHPFSPAATADDDSYRPLIATWLIRLALRFDWFRPSPEGASERDWPPAFLRLTGLRSETLTADARESLQQRLDELMREPLDPGSPLFANVVTLGALLGMNEIEKTLLIFAALVGEVPEFGDLLNSVKHYVTNRQFHALMDVLLGCGREPIRAALREDGLLITSGLVYLESSQISCAHKLYSPLASFLVQPGLDESQWVERLLVPASAARLGCDAFPHLKGDIDLLRTYLRRALDEAVPGVNILFHGNPGTGKTELAKALAADLAVDLFEVPFSADDEPLSGRRRLSQCRLAQRLLARRRSALILFDEIEDIFLEERDDRNGTPRCGKAYLNRLLERNPLPMLWITNDANLDPAYLRRFDYSIRFTTPPLSVRLNIVRHHFGTLHTEATWLAGIAARGQLSPAQIEGAAKVARVTGAKGEPASALIEQVLERSTALLGQTASPTVAQPASYDLDFIHTDLDIAPLIAGLRRRPRGRFCFFGPPGTGKSALAAHIADTLGQPLLQRRASDLLSMWVGAAEKAIAAMFAEARREEAVLVLDEADSFLQDRRTARHSWEITQVNEFLTQMEAFDGVLICTTNLGDDLDPASLRRFDFKLHFKPLTPIQRWRMFRSEFERLGGNPETLTAWEAAVRGLDGLTPGDFALVERQYLLRDTRPEVEGYYESLRRECAVKEGARRGMGFLGPFETSRTIS